MAGPCRAPLFLSLLVLAAALAPPAAAHAEPVESSPPGGSVVQALPREVVVRFSEPLEAAFSHLELRDANGTAVSPPGTLDADGVTMRAAVPRNLSYGVYTAAWRALSTVDGHSTRGLISFLYPDPSKPLNLTDLPTDAPQPTYTPSPFDAALRGLALVGLFALLGTSVLVLVALRSAGSAPPGAEPLLAGLAAAGAALGAVATLLLAASQAAAAAQVSLPEALVRPDALMAGRFGSLAIQRVLVLSIAAVVAAMARRQPIGSREATWSWVACAASGIAAAFTLGFSSHGAALPSPLLGASIDVVHIVAAAAWVGGLAGLGWALYGAREPAPPPSVASRFSALATVAVAVAVLTGVVAAVLRFRSLDPLFTTPFGQVLLLKLALVAVLLAFGARNKVRLVPALLRSPGDPAPAARFGRSVRLEALVGVGVLLAAGALTALSPPLLVASPARPEAQAMVEPSQVKDGINATLIVTPATLAVGPTTFDRVLSPNGLTLGDTNVPLPEADIGPFAGEGGASTTPETGASPPS